MMGELNYLHEFARIELMASLAVDVDVISLSARLEHAEIDGPLLHPSDCMFGEGLQELQEQRMLLEAFLPFWQAARQLKERHNSELR
jgi:hypothetical protein